MREIRFKISRLEKVILAQTLIISISLAILGVLGVNYPYTTNYVGFFKIVSILMILLMIIRIFGSLNVKIYFDLNTIIQTSLFPKKTTNITINNITQVIVKKHMVIIYSTESNNKKTLVIPKSQSIDLDGYNELLKILTNTNIIYEYKSTDNLVLNMALLKILASLLFCSQLIILLLLFNF